MLACSTGMCVFAPRRARRHRLGLTSQRPPQIWSLVAPRSVQERPSTKTVDQACIKGGAGCGAGGSAVFTTAAWYEGWVVEDMFGELPPCPSMMFPWIPPGSPRPLDSPDPGSPRDRSWPAPIRILPTVGWACQGRLPSSIHLRKVATRSGGQLPSHGMSPSSSRARMPSA